MTVQTATHLNFRGQARDALGFYQSVFGGELTLVTYRNFGAADDDPQADDVIWGQVVAENGFRVMAYDIQHEKSWHPGENAFYVSLRGDDAEEIVAYWEKLEQGATVLQPLSPAPWSPLYGMLTDRFGTTWVVDVRVDRPA